MQSLPDKIPAPLLPPENPGCAFITGDPRAGAAAVPRCGAPCRPGSDFCPEHHASCHLRGGGRAERQRLATIEAFAATVGGRLGKSEPEPPPTLLRRLARIERAFLRPRSSRFVQDQKSMPTAAQGPDPHLETAQQAPTPERLQHGPVEQTEATISDTAGRPSRPYRAVDTLQLMERRGSISAGMRQAGEDFRARFTVAQLDPLRALDLSHLRLGEPNQCSDSGPGLRIEAARNTVWRAIQAVGGLGSPAGSCLWHVLGWQCSIKEWAVEQGWSGRRVSQETAAGILIAALGALESHFAANR